MNKEELLAFKKAYNELLFKIKENIEKFETLPEGKEKQALQDEIEMDALKLQGMNGPVTVLLTPPEQTHEVVTVSPAKQRNQLNKASKFAKNGKK